jgi:hypothetical protein
VRQPPRASAHPRLDDQAHEVGGDHLPGYAQVNVSLSHRFESAPAGPLTVRLDLINAFDHVYEIRDGTGVGVGAPQFGPRSGLSAGITKAF